MYCISSSHKSCIFSVVLAEHQRNVELHFVSGPHRLFSVHAGALGAARMAGARTACRSPIPAHVAPPAAPSRHAAQRAARPEAAARRCLRWRRARGPRLQCAGGHVVREGLARDDPLAGVRGRRYGAPHRTPDSSPLAHKHYCQLLITNIRLERVSYFYASVLFGSCL